MIGWAFHFKQYPTGAAANAQTEVGGARLVSIRNLSPQHADDAQNGTLSDRMKCSNLARECLQAKILVLARTMRMRGQRPAGLGAQAPSDEFSRH
jgi:hypothetical protein